MTNRQNATAAATALANKQGSVGSVTPTNLASDQLQVIINNTAMSDELPSSGFVDYSHSGGGQAAAANTWITLNNDGAGASTNTGSLPSGVTSMLLSNSVDLSDLSIGDYIVVRSTFAVTPTTNNQSIDLQYTLGTGVASYTVGGFAGQLRQGAGISEKFSITELIYVGDANTRNNPVGIQVRTSGPSTIQNIGFAAGISIRGL